ncbi:acetyl-CoA carboxylase biotin carboxylase subunit family protein [Streptomyces sp. NPDC005955]|uniref:ATP-grasp domain-containing protein n=1 Tax=Streptomyces sp. NPDC005955 TaxID=3364738 RepID=UPI003680A988
MSVLRRHVLVIDHIGYRYYQDVDGRKFLPADENRVHLLTDIRKLDQARGDELETVIGIPRGDDTLLEAAALMRHDAPDLPVDSVVAISEGLLLTAARLRDKLGVPGPTEQQVLGYRDKVIMKDRLRENGIRVPDYAPFTESAAQRLLARHGKVVAKPRRSESSAGIAILGCLDDLCGFLDATTEGDLTPDAYEVEEHIDGTLFHIDSVVSGGVPLAATAGRSIEETTSYRHLGAFRDVAVGQGETLDRLLRFNREVLACYPHFSGVTHHEVFLSGEDVVFCEIGGRPGGGGIIPGFYSRTGVNLDEMAVRAHLGEEITPPAPPADHLTGYALVYAPPGRLEADLTLPDTEWIIDTQLRFRPGDLMARPTAWNQAAATVTVRGRSEDEVTSRLDQVIDMVQGRLREGEGSGVR